MANIYISSTYVDLHEERKAASQAVHRLKGHRAIAMEDYVASDQRPLDKCLQDVRSCDAYVGIFAWRYGHIPAGYDKSITHLEYEEAGKANIPRLIFLLDKKAPWPREYVSTGEEQKNIDQLRDELKTDHIVSFFNNAAELGGLVSAAVSGLELAKKKPDREKPQLGPIVSKMCNRIPQVHDFMKFFREKSRECPRRPQFYFIHGDDLQGHDCFLERLMKTCLKEFAEKQWGEEYATIRLDEVPWPNQGKLPDRQEYLQRNLMAKFGGYHETPDLSANTLGNLPCFAKRPLVLIKHNIYSSKWDKPTPPLLAWYINEYWGKLEPGEHHDIPLFLVFFNVRYQQSAETGLIQKLWKRGPSGKEQILAQLRQLQRSSAEKCPCCLLSELTPIEIEEVRDWFSEYNLVEFEWERIKIIEAIFKENDRPVTSLCWAKLEIELANIVKRYRYQREEMHL